MSNQDGTSPQAGPQAGPQASPQAGPQASAKPRDVTYPVCGKLNINFSAYEDRLVVSAERKGTAPATLLLTRRMTVLVLQQVVARLPEVSGLQKTPAEYWQEVLQMAHQRAKDARVDAQQRTVEAEADRAAAGERAQSGDVATEGVTAENIERVEGVENPESAEAGPPELFLATELTLRPAEGHLTLAFRGLPLPEAMMQPRQHVPVLALPLDRNNVHQLIELLISKAQEANWHLPVDLPWLEAPADTAGSGVGARTH